MVREDRIVRESEEAERPKYRKTGDEPTPEEIEEHNIDHGVFRAWCPHCVKGRAEAYGHKSKKKVESEIPRICIDYMYMHSEQSTNEEKGMPTLLMKDSKTKTVCAWTVPRKGIDAYAIVMLRKMIERLGHKRIVMRSDNEPAILALKEAVRRETDIEVVLEEVPVGDHAANGIV